MMPRLLPLLALLLAAILPPGAAPAGAAALEGVTMPDRLTVGGTELTLNGMALRAYSMLRIPIYVAGLYLARPDHDADRILRSPEPKLVDMRFLRDVSLEQGRQAWQEGFDDNCRPPCRIAPGEVDHFMAAVAAVKKGDRFTILIANGGADLAINGARLGTTADRHFASIILATFIGEHPVTPRIRQELLGLDRPPGR
jgi:hypothetical protein